MFEDYYGYPYNSFNIFDYLLQDGAFPRFDPSLVPSINEVVPVEPQPQYAPVTAEPVYAPPTLLPIIPERVPAEPVYTLPPRQPIVAEPAPVEPVYTLPTRQPVMPESTPVEPTYTLPTPQPVVAEPVPAEPVYTLPTPQPIVAEPVPAEPVYSTPTPQPVMAEAIPAISPLLPTISESPVAEQTAAVTPPSEPDMSGIAGWDPSMINTGPLNILSDPGPAYDPNMVYRFDTGNKIGVPNAQGGFDYQNAAPVVFQPGQQYVMTDGSGKNVIARASTPEEMQKLVDLSSSNKDWKLYQADSSGNITPGTQLFDRSNAGSFGSMILPMAAIAGLGFGLTSLGLGAGAGAGATGAMPSVGAALADVGAQLAGTSVFGLPAAATTAGTLAAAAAPAAASGLLSEVAPIVVTGAKTAADLGTLATVLGAPTAAGLANLANSVSSFQPPVESTTPPSVEPTPTPAEEIVVEAAKKPPLDIFDIMTLPASTTLAPNTSTITEPSTVQPQAPDEIVVEGTRQPPPSIEDIMTLPASTTLAPNTSNITEPSTLQPEAQQDTLLRDIMRYYSLGSGLLDALGVGKGGGTTTATPYTSTLGVLPTFGRGPFTPFQGDYETYGQGPEWNFFGGK